MFNLTTLLQTVGYFGIFGIIFAETGLLLGFFLPGDSLLFTAGILASQDYFNIYILLAIMFTAAVIGDSVGYKIGSKLGPKIFTKEESIIFHRSHVEKAQKFFDKHGPKTIILARFVPIVRTFAPTLAGVGKMKYKTFLLYNILGALLWVLSITLLGYFLGKSVPNAEKYILPGVIIIVILSFTPFIKQLITDKSLRQSIYHSFIQILEKIFK